MTKRQEKIGEIEKIGVSRSKADTITEKFEDLFDLRATNLTRDLVGMEEVKTRLKRKGEEIEELKRVVEDKKKRQKSEKWKRMSTRVSGISNISGLNQTNSLSPLRRTTMKKTK